MEWSSPDPSCNPYAVALLLIVAGLSGVRDNLQLPSPSDFDGSLTPAEKRLPQTLGAAIDEAWKSDFIHAVLPEKYLSQYFVQKGKEFEAYRAANDPYRYEIERYFDRI